MVKYFFDINCYHYVIEHPIFFARSIMTCNMYDIGRSVCIVYIVLFSVFTITYCAEIWGNTCKSNTQCIFLLQKKIVRIVYGANFTDHTDVIFQDLIFF